MEREHNNNRKIENLWLLSLFLKGSVTFWHFVVAAFVIPAN